MPQRAEPGDGAPPTAGRLQRRAQVLQRHRRRVARQAGLRRASAVTPPLPHRPRLRRAPGGGARLRLPRRRAGDRHGRVAAPRGRRLPAPQPPPRHPTRRPRLPVAVRRRFIRTVRAARLRLPEHGRQDRAPRARARRPAAAPARRRARRARREPARAVLPRGHFRRGAARVRLLRPVPRRLPLHAQHRRRRLPAAALRRVRVARLHARGGHEARRRRRQVRRVCDGRRRRGSALPGRGHVQRGACARHASLPAAASARGGTVGGHRRRALYPVWQGETVALCRDPPTTITISSDLSWNARVDEIISKARKRVYMIYHLKRAGINQNDLIRIYVYVVRPVVEYACPVWHYHTGHIYLNMYRTT